MKLKRVSEVKYACSIFNAIIILFCYFQSCSRKYFCCSFCFFLWICPLVFTISGCLYVIVTSCILSGNKRSFQLQGQYVLIFSVFFLLHVNYSDLFVTIPVPCRPQARPDYKTKYSGNSAVHFYLFVCRSLARLPLCRN